MKFSAKRAMRWSGGALLLVFALWVGLAPAYLKRAWRRPLGAEHPAGRYETVRFPAADGRVEITAWWLRPAAPRAALVLVHGGSSNRGDRYADWAGAASALVGRGYAVLSIDLRNHGDSGATPEGPSFGAEEAYDVIGAVNWLAAREPSLPVGVAGYSMGGATAIQAAARDPRIRAVLAADTYAEFRPVMRRAVWAETGLPAFLIAPMLVSAEHLWGLQLGRGRTIDVVGRLAPRPLLLCHASDDPIVPFDSAERLHAAYPQAELWVYPAVDEGDERRRSWGRWGTHAKGYLLHPKEWLDHADAFFTAALR